MTPLRPEEAIGSTDVIEAGHTAIAAAAAAIAGSAESDADAAGRLFDWVRDEIEYDMAPELASREDWRASATLERGYGFCQQKAVLLAALLRARGIPAGLCAQDLLDHKIPRRYVDFLGSQRLEVHGLTIAWLDGAWQRLDATLDRGLAERKGYRLVEFRSGEDCVLPATDLAGAPHFDVLEELGAWPDLPQELVERTLSYAYLHDPAYRRMARRYGPPV